MTCITSAAFGMLANGRAVQLYTLRNHRGMEAKIMTYGGIVTVLTAPDREGHYGDVALGFDSVAAYVRNSPYFGALIGRYGNRIARGRFTLDGTGYTLPINNPPNSLHGGAVGFDKVVWEVRGAHVTPRGPELTLRYMSPDGDQGYPGSLSVIATYTLTEGDALRLDYTAVTDNETVANLTQHSYFNLRRGGDILGHRVQIHADQFTPVDATLIPTGELRPVKQTPFDFREPHEIGARIETKDEQLLFGNGYDHNWVMRTGPGSGAVEERLQDVATVYEPETGRILTVRSTQPGLQFYSGNLLDGTLRGKGGRAYGRRSGFCMEPQHYPDSPNHPNFPSSVLRPGEIYQSSIVYAFSAR